MTNEEVEALILSAPCSQLLGRRLIEHDEKRGWIKFEFDGRADLVNPAGRIQGGLVTAMLDETMGRSCFSRVAAPCTRRPST